MAATLRVTVQSAALVYDKKALKATLRVAGNEVASATRSLIRSAAGGGRTYYGSGGSSGYRGGYRKGRYQASVADAAPKSLTGALAGSIRVRPFKSGEGVAVRSNQFYALFLQAGAKGGGGTRGAKNIYQTRGRVRSRIKVTGSRVLAPRPFLTRVLEARQTSLGPRIQAAALSGVKMVRVKK